MHDGDAAGACAAGAPRVRETPDTGQLNTELLGDLAQGSMLDEGGAKGLVLAMEGLGGFEEEAAVVDVIHARGSAMRVDCGRMPGPMVGRQPTASKGSDRV
jgi:hypothetical protein